ncbi:MAG: hybrid sensor histidine kinase/response regulator [Polyangiaceae bacterium]|nr:hybrid sensor histidine kinase/response regulator [Polyangiaceae bacterium]
MAKVLHIEDDPANRLLVRKLLANAGFEVVEAADGLEGIRKALSARPDLVLVDIAIPGLDGYEVTLRLRAEPSLQGVPIVAITAEGHRDTSLAVGCDGYLRKPIDARSFARTVGGYLDGRRENVAPEEEGEHLRRQGQRMVSHLEGKLAELERAHARLTELDQARREFYRNVSHELATPMTPIVGYVRLLADGELGPTTPAQAKALRAMGDCVDRLRGLIDNLLDVTGLETGRLRLAPRPCDLAALVAAVVERKRHAAGVGERLLLAAPTEPVPAVADPARVTRAVEHLIDNALKFTPAPGAVGVEVRRRADGGAEVWVADDGPGVTPERRERIFEPFVQGDGSVTRAHGGTGIGLAVVRGIAQGHGGDVTLELDSEERIAGRRRQGAVFRLSLAREPPAGEVYE